MKSCFVHIGSEKTGTTSIQRYFGRNRDALLKDGYWYPQAGCYQGPHVHKRLSDAVMGRDLDDGDELFEEFTREHRTARKAGAHTAIFSSEFFHSKLRDADSVAYLHAFLNRFFERIVIVYYARRQDHLAVSMHSTGVRGGGSTNRSALSVYRNKGHYYFDHLAISDLWAAEFGRENIVCRIYDRSKLAEGDVIVDFSRIAGLDRLYDAQTFAANKSLPAECMDVLLLLNASPFSGNDRFRKELVLIGRERGGTKLPMLTKAEAQEFLSRFRDNNKAFFAKYIDPSMATDFDAGFDSFPDALPPPATGSVLEFLFGPLPDGGGERDVQLSARLAKGKRPKAGTTRRTRKRRKAARAQRAQAARR